MLGIVLELLAICFEIGDSGAAIWFRHLWFVGSDSYNLIPFSRTVAFLELSPTPARAGVIASDLGFVLHKIDIVYENLISPTESVISLEFDGSLHS